MNLINSKNRTPAKRLLNSFYDSRDVRTMTLEQLNFALNRSINSGLITIEGAQRALGIDSKDERRASHSDRGNSEERNEAERDERDDEQSSNGNDKDGDDSNGNESDGGRDSSNSEESSNGDENESESESDSSNESESESDEDGNGSSSKNSNGEDDDESDGDDGDNESEDESENEKDDSSNSEDDSNDESNESDSSNEDDEDEDDDEDIQHEAFKTVLKWIKAGQNVALVGPAGSGKSYITRKVAEELGREFRVNGAMMSKYDLIGYCDANGTYHETPAYDAFINGHIHCFDEADASAPDAMVAFNGMTDDQPYFTFPNGMHPKHENYVAIACMNTWGNGATADYVGRYKQDAASMSRFVKVLVNYDRKVEAKIAGKKNLDIAQRVWDLRDACETLGIRHVVSTRMITQAVAGRTLAKVSKADIDRDVLFAGLDENAIAQVKSQMAKISRDRALAKG